MRRYGAPHRVIVSSLNCQSGLKHALAFVYIRNRFVKFPHRRVKTGYLEGNLPHVVIDLAETLYTFRHRVRRSGKLNLI